MSERLFAAAEMPYAIAAGATATIPLFKVAMSTEAPAAVECVLLSGYIGQGPKVEQFEQLLGEEIGNPCLVTVNSATSGLHLALHLLPELRNGDEVLTTPLTCTATNWPILANRLRIRWVDVDPMTMNIDLDDLARKITPATRAIMVVHWGGYPVDLDRLRSIQENTAVRYGFMPPVIEDCAHAWASTYKGRRLGNHGNSCVFSFQAIKHLTAGDGGLLVLPNEALYRRAKRLRWFGIDRENRADLRCESDIAEYGFKFHMNDINATIGIANLQIVDDVVRRHRANAAYYDEQLRDVPGIRLLERSADRSSSFWLYTMHVERRDDFVRTLTEAGIAVSRVHERNDIHSCVREYAAMLPNLDRVIGTMICIPTGWWVTPDNREHIVRTIRAGW